MADNTELLLAQGDLAAQTAVEDKIGALQNKSQEKAQKLGGGVEDPYSLASGNGLVGYLSTVTGANNSSTGMTGTSMHNGAAYMGQVHTQTAEEIQSSLSRLADNQVYPGSEIGKDPSKKYIQKVAYANTPENPTNDSKTWYVEAPKNKWGRYDEETVYIRYGKQPGTVKVGLARNDLTEEAKAINPNASFWRYATKEMRDGFGMQGRSPYRGRGGLYARPHAPNSVDLAKAPLMDMEVLSSAAKKFEYDKHRDTTEINARAMGTGESNYGLYGGGAHEYTIMNKDILFNDQAKIVKDVPAGTALPGVPKGFNPDGTVKYMPAYAEAASLDVNKIVDALKNRESSGDYTVVNKGGYVGAYQFGASRLADMGLVKIGTKNKQLNDPSVWTGKDGASSLDKFLGNKELQDQTALRSVNDLARQTKGAAGSISDWYGKIMAAHLLGVKGSKKLSAKDGNGTSGQTYYDIGVKLAGINSGNSDSAIEKALQKADDERNHSVLGVAENLVRGTASSFLSTTVAGIDAIVNDLPDWVIGEGEKLYYDHKIGSASSEAEKVKYTKEKNDAIKHSFKMNGLTSFIHGDGYNDTQEYYKDGVFKQATDEGFGVDTGLQAEEQKVVEDLVAKGEYGKAALKGLTSSTVISNVTGSIVSFMFGTGEARAIGLVSKNSGKIGELYRGIISAKKAGNMEKVAELTQKAKAELNVAQKIAAKAIERTGATTMFTSTVNQIMVSRNKTKGNVHGDLTDVAIAVPAAALETLVGLESAEIIMKPGVHEALRVLGTTLDKNVADRIWKKVLKTAGRLTLAAGKGAVVETPEEYTQQWADILGRKWNTSKKGDDVASIFSNTANQNEAIVAGVEGLGGVHVSVGSQGLHELGDMRLGGKKEPDDGKINVDELNSAVEAVNKWDDPAGKVNAYIRAKRKGEEHGLTPVEEKQAADYIMAHILAADQQIKALKVLMESSDVSEKDKIEHAATIDKLTDSRTKQWMAYVDVTNSDSTVLNNRPIEDIDKEIAEVDTKLQGTKDNGEKAKLDARMKVLAVERHIAEQLQSPELQKLAEKIDKSATTDGINTQGKRTTAAETLANKLYSGASDESGQKRGMLEYARMIFNPNIPEEVKQNIVNDMDHFLGTQKKKAAAALAAKEDYETHNDGKAVSKVYGKYQDGSDATFTYRSPKESEKFVQTLVAENDLLDSIYSKIMNNEGQINEQDKTTQTRTTESTPTEKRVEPIVEQNQQSSEVRGEAPTKTVGKGEQVTFDFGSGGVETKAPIKPKESGRELLNHPRLKELLDMRENILAKDTTYAQILVNKRYIHNGDNGRLDTKVTPAGYEKNWVAQFSLTKKDVKAIRDGKVTDEIYSKLQNDLGVLDNSPEWALQDSAKLVDKDKLLKAIDEVKMQAMQSEGVSQQQIDQRLSTLDKLMDKLYEDYMREDSATVKNQIDDAVKQLHDRVTPGIKVLQKLVDTQIDVREQTQELKKSEQKLMRLKAKLVGTPKVIIEKLWDKIYAAKQAYENKYADAVLTDSTIKSKKERAKERVAITKQANNDIEQDVGIRPFSGGKTKGIPKATTKTTKARLMAIKSAGVSEETLYNDYSRKTGKIQNEIDNTEEQVAMKEANLADSKEQLDKLKAERKKANSKNTIGDIIITEYSRKTEEDNKLIMDALKNMDKTDQATIKEILGCK